MGGCHNFRDVIYGQPLIISQLYHVLKCCFDGPNNSREKNMSNYFFLFFYFFTIPWFVFPSSTIFFRRYTKRKNKIGSFFDHFMHFSLSQFQCTMFKNRKKCKNLNFFKDFLCFPGTVIFNRCVAEPLVAVRICKWAHIKLYSYLRGRP